MWSDLTLGPYFKVKRWFTGLGELVFRWMQIGIGSLMHGSSFILICYELVTENLMIGKNLTFISHKPYAEFSTFCCSWYFCVLLT